MRVWRAMAAQLPPSRPVLRTSPPSRGQPVFASAQEHIREPLGSSSVRKSRKRKSCERESSILGLGKTRKPFADHKSGKQPASGALGESAGAVASTVESDESLVILSERNLELDKALPRRRSWTPIADHSPNEALELANGASPDVSSNESSALFDSLSSRYGYSTAKTSDRAASNSSASIHECTRRRKVELTREPTQSKPHMEMQPVPKQKKRPLTITEKATELYRRQSEPEGPDVSIESQSAAKLGDSHSKGKPRKKQGKAATLADSAPPRILSHEEAYRAFDSQDLVFGTSSQLAGDESPSTVKDLQKAISLSLGAVPEVELSGPKGSTSASQSSGERSSLALARSSRRLWAEASRDNTGSTVKPEVIDLTDSPYGLARLNLCNSPSLQRQSTGEASAINVGNKPHEPLLAPKYSSVQMSEHPKPIGDPFAAPRSARSRMEELIQPDRAETVESNPQPQMPAYNEWADEELQRAISGYGFKKMRNRKNMIARLEKCWQSLHPGIEGSTSPVKESSTKASAKKGRSKASKAVKEDSLAALNKEVETVGTVAAVDQERLFAKIHEAIVTATPPADPAELSWHAKILLYDPIIIEDLTVWLNAGHLTQVGVDEEVAPRDVRDWCESRSVCCLWRLNLRGGVRIRF